MVPVALHEQWLLGFFQANRCYDRENCLPFRLHTAPFIFDLSAKAFY